METGESSETIIHEELNDVEKKTTASIPGLTGMSGRAGTFGVSCGPRDLNNEIRGVSVRLAMRRWNPFHSDQLRWITKHPCTGGGEGTLGHRHFAHMPESCRTTGNAGIC